MRPDIVVIGGGTVGAALAYGLAKRSQKVLLLDGDDGDFRAARANFGLVWLQGKGLGMAAYQALTRDSIDLWRGFCAELEDETELSLSYEQNGGLAFCLGEEAFERRRLDLMRLHNQRGEGEPDWEMLDRQSLQKLLPKVSLGAAVSGASFGRRDGHANPLRLLAALHRALVLRGGAVRHRSRVERIETAGSDFRLVLEGETLVAPRIVIAAGLGSPALARQVGLDVPVRPERGQVLVTERLAPFLPLPASGLRQTGDGTIMIGATKEDTGFDASATAEAAARLSRTTVSIAPALAQVRLVRQWAGLRIMTPDGYPIYTQSRTHPGAFVALCHSGVTLAAFHAETLAEAIVEGALPPNCLPSTRVVSMFRKLHDPGSSTVTIHVDGVAVPAESGESVAAVLLRQAAGWSRMSPVSLSPRAPFCMMGVCFECLVDIDGQGSVQGCLTPVRDGMTVTRPQGRRGLPA